MISFLSLSSWKTCCPFCYEKNNIIPTSRYRLNVTYFKIPQSDGISPRLYLHLPLKKLFLNWMLLEKNNEEVKKPEQKCLVLFFHNKNKKEQNISFSCAFFPQQKQKRDGKFLDLMDHALSPISLFPNYEKF